MKQFNRILLGISLLWLIILGSFISWLAYSLTVQKDKEYLVEINRIQEKMKQQQGYQEIDLSPCRYITRIDFLPSQNEDTVSMFIPSERWPVIMKQYFEGSSISYYKIKAVPVNQDYIIKPLYNTDELKGYVRYSYRTGETGRTLQLLSITVLVMLLIFAMALGLLLYIRQNILKPFHEISELPYELSKGHLTTSLKETKNRYFGKFLWGLELLRDSLEEHKRKELQMEKDKKLMILSISHDIKTPLSTIKLYSKALYENLYQSEEKRHLTAKNIEEKADQIERFVAEIIKTSSTELFEYDMKTEDFYLHDLMMHINKTYKEKLELLKIDFCIASYQDKMLHGDPERLIDVFDNIMQNAIKYGDGKRITLSFEEEDNCQLIRVTNTGIPLPTTDFVHMFESFWRGGNSHGKQGNGLGLYICKQLMQKMGGEIFAEAKDDHMSMVVVIRKS